MANPTTVLGNLLSHFPRSEFEKAVQELDGDKGVRTLSCFDMVKTLLYGQVRGRSVFARLRVPWLPTVRNSITPG